MSTPYRDSPPPPTDDDADVIDKIHPPTRVGRYLLSRTILSLLAVCFLVYTDDTDGIIRLCITYYVPVLFSVVIVLLEKPVRAWFERRYARNVARGIIELEERASRIGSERKEC